MSEVDEEAHVLTASKANHLPESVVGGVEAVKGVPQLQNWSEDESILCGTNASVGLST